LFGMSFFFASLAAGAEASSVLAYPVTAESPSRSAHIISHTLITPRFILYTFCSRVGAVESLTDVSSTGMDEPIQGMSSPIDDFQFMAGILTHEDSKVNQLMN
ncbi:MAG: hypothetical protein ABFR19_04795, partial [Pseudomonadota bacterium]